MKILIKIIESQITNILLFSILVLLSKHSFTQSSINLGLGYCSNLSNSEKVKPSQSISMLKGIYISSSFGKKINKTSIIKVGINYANKNYSIIKTEKFKGVSHKFINSYLKFPVILQTTFYSRNRISISSNFGYYASYWLFSKTKGFIPNLFDTEYSIDDNGQIVQKLSLNSYNREVDLTKNKKNRFDNGLIIGLNVSHQLSNNLSLFIEPLFYYSLKKTKQQHYLKTPDKLNQTIAILLGCSFNLKEK